MSHFLVLLYDNVDDADQWLHMSPEEMQRVIEKLVAWSEGLSAQGRLVASEKLRDGSGRVLRGRGGSPTVHDGPFSETKEIIGGYFIVAAADYAEAVRLTRDCPHLEYGGTIEIREIEPMAVPEQAPAVA